MKQQLKIFLSLLILALISIGVFAQEQRRNQPRFPRWISEKGYWVIESNLHKPLEHVIRFYNNDHVLLYSKSLAGVKLDPDKRKVKMKLKRELESAVVAWEKKTGHPSQVSGSVAGLNQPF